MAKIDEKNCSQPMSYDSFLYRFCFCFKNRISCLDVSASSGIGGLDNLLLFSLKENRPGSINQLAGKDVQSCSLSDRHNPFIAKVLRRVAPTSTVIATNIQCLHWRERQCNRAVAMWATEGLAGGGGVYRVDSHLWGIVQE